MSVDTSKTMLKIFGIVNMILGVMILIFSAMTLAGGGLLASGVVPMDQAEAGVSGALVFGVGGAMLVLGAFSFASGILSRRAAKDPSKAQPAFVFAIGAVLAVPNLVLAITGGGSLISAVVCLGINALLVVAANTLRKENTAEALAA